MAWWLIRHTLSLTLCFIKKNPTRCNNVSKFFYYSIFIWSSTCFRRHTAHYQEPKTALAASGFSYVEGCWTCSFRLLMMGGVSPETYRASYKYGIIKFWYIFASFWIFLYESASLNEIESFTELRMISAVAWDREEADPPDTWSYPDLPEPATESRNNFIKIGDHEI